MAENQYCLNLTGDCSCDISINVRSGFGIHW